MRNAAPPPASSSGRAAIYVGIAPPVQGRTGRRSARSKIARREHCAAGLDRHPRAPAIPTFPPAARRVFAVRPTRSAGHCRLRRPSRFLASRRAHARARLAEPARAPHTSLSLSSTATALAGDVVTIDSAADHHSVRAKVVVTLDAFGCRRLHPHRRPSADWPRRASAPPHVNRHTPGGIDPYRRSTVDQPSRVHKSCEIVESRRGR